VTRTAALWSAHARTVWRATWGVHRRRAKHRGVRASSKTRPRPKLKIKRQYEDLLGIRVEKLKGRILNRERINKTIEGVYFVCAECKKVCHNIDEGLVEDPDNVRNMCSACGKAKPKGKQAAA